MKKKALFFVVAAIILLTNRGVQADGLRPAQTHGIKLEYVNGDDEKLKPENDPAKAQRVDAAIIKLYSNLDSTLNNPNSVLLQALKNQKAKRVLVEIQVLDSDKISPTCKEALVQKEKGGCAMTAIISLFNNRDCITTQDEFFRLGVDELRSPGCKDSVDKDTDKDEDGDKDSDGDSSGDGSKPSKKSVLKHLFHRSS